MEINVIIEGHRYPLYLNKNDSIREIKKKIIEKLITESIPHDSHSFYLKAYDDVLEDDQKLSDFDIEEDDDIYLYFYYEMNVGGYIDNLKEESKRELAQKIGFDMNLIERDELNINLIHFDLHMTNGENYRYFNKFKVDVVGGFHAMDDINIFKKFLEKISKKKIPFLVVSSGSSAKDILPICKQYSFIKEVIIFCMNYGYHKHYIDEYPGYVKKVTTSISELYQYLKKFYAKNLCKDCNSLPYQFKDYEIQMDKQIQDCPVITAEEYDKCYFLVHRAFSYFFGSFESKYHSFREENYIIIKELLNTLSSRAYFKNNDDQERLSNIFQKLKNTEEYHIFVEKSIRTYTGESIFCYLFNRMMRNLESGLISLIYYMGPLLFELNKYVRNYKDYAFTKSMTLYRRLKCSDTEMYLYKLNLNHVICFLSLTSTSSKEINFTPTGLASNINKTGYDTRTIELIIKYNHESGNISPGIIIEDKKGHDGSGETISHCPGEKEVILFPFTFAKILSINFEGERKIVNLELINRKSYIELDLKNNVNNRPKFSDI